MIDSFGITIVFNLQTFTIAKNFSHVSVNSRAIVTSHFVINVTLCNT